MNDIIKKILFLSIIGGSILLASFNSSLYDKKKIAQTYYESKLYEDAIIVYEEIYQIEKEIFGYNNLNLLKTVKTIYTLYQLNNNLEKTKKYIQEYLNIQSSFIINQQNTYIAPLEDLKNIYINEKKAELVFRIDSLLTIIDTNMDQFKNDSLFTLPNLIVNTDPDYETDTEYSINDYALEKMNEAFNYLDNNQ